MDERGFTLVELLVSATILVLIMMATFSVLDGSSKTARRDTERAHAIREAQVGIDRMVRELRHTQTVHSASAQVLDVTVLQRGVTQRVVFDCSVASPGTPGARRCTRTPSGGSADVLVDRVRNIGADSSAFAYTPPSGTIRHVMVRLGVAADGGRAEGYRNDVVLSNGTALRNVP